MGGRQQPVTGLRMGRALVAQTFEGESDVSPEAVSRVFPAAMQGAVRTIEATVVAALQQADEAVRSHCLIVAMATWVHELDKAGRLDMTPRDVAFVYQAGRIAAQETPEELQPHLASVLQSIAWTDLAQN